MTQLPLFQHQAERPRLDPAQPYRERLAHLLAGDLDFHEADSTYATHALHAFPAKFPPQLPRLFIRELTKPDDVVFDPLVGSGTTLVEAVLAGRRAAGSDIDPLALRLCRVKVTPLPLDEVIRFGVAVCRQAERMVQEQPAQVEALVQQRFDDRTRAFVEYWFYPRTILELMALVTAIEAIEPEDVRAFLEVTFSGIIVTKSGGVSRARDLAHTRPHRVLDKPPRSAFEAFRQRLRKNVEALAALAHCAPRVELYEADAQALPLEDESVDLIVTSPPYADQRKRLYGGVPPDEYVDWFLQIADEIRRILKPAGTFILNIKERVVKGERHTYVLELILAMRKRGWLWTEEFIWHKKNCYPGKWPNRFRDAWERLLQFNKQRRFKMNQEAVMVPVGDWAKTRLRSLSETDLRRDESRVGSGFGKRVANWLEREMVYPTNVLHLATECANRGHPAAFPLSLPEWFIKLFTDPEDVVLDPFAGVGTTMQAALALDRHAWGIEWNPEYAELAKSRLRERFRQPSLL